MTKLCPRGKAAAKRKFKVYPSAYANAYASKICAGKIKDPSGVKRKDFRGRKPSAMGGRIFKDIGGPVKDNQDRITIRRGRKLLESRPKDRKVKPMLKPKTKTKLDPRIQQRKRPKMMGGGLMEATQRLRRQGLRGGGGFMSKRAMMYGK